MPEISLGTIMSIANMVLRALQEAPGLVDHLESFWKNVIGNPVAPPHIDAAVKAAIAHVRENPAT